MHDLISRQGAITEFSCCELTPDGGIDANYAIDFLKHMPSAQPDPSACWACNCPKMQLLEKAEPHEIGYSECADAMLKMWIDNVLTDGEYNRIMDKLNAHWAERREE